MVPLLLTIIVIFCLHVITASVRHGSWMYRAPCAAVGLWSGVVALAPVTALAALAILAADPHTRQLGTVVPNAVAVTLSCLLLAGAGQVAARFRVLNRAARQRRRRHEMLIDLFATGRPDLGNVDVIPDERLFAYSVPCVVSGRTVLSQGAVDQLEPAALQAVLRHERRHLLARHHLVLQLAAAVAQSFPSWRAAAGLPARITELVEMSADCYARRHVGRRPTIDALVALADMPVPAGGLPVGGRAVELRLATLRSTRYCCRRTRSVAAYALGAGLLVLAPSMAYLNRIYDLCPWGAT